MRILVAEDDATMRFILTRMLEKWNYEVVCADNGNAAWKVICEPNPPPIALIDWVMPGMDGVEICRCLKERRNLIQGSFTYAILLTSRNDQKDVATGLNAGADDFIRKPADPAELRSRLSAGERIVEYERQLLRKEKEVRIECYRALGMLAETRDEETGRHLERIARYSQLICTFLGLPESYQEDLGTFSPLHDIGKVGIPDNILLAPRRLEPYEFEVMKTHAELGYRILNGRPSMELGAEICHGHHERWCGGGYPLGIQGDEIPLSARIVAITDVYDALRSRRPYKMPWTHEKAIQIIHDEKGKHFDPNIALAVCDNHEKFRAVGLPHEVVDGDYT